MTNNKTAWCIAAWTVVGCLGLAGSASAQFPTDAFHPHDDRPLDKSDLQAPMTVRGVERLPNGVKLSIDSGQTAYIRLINEGTAKVSLLNRGVGETNSPAIADTKLPTPQFSVSDDGRTVTLRSADLTVKVNKRPFGVKFLDREGNLINEDGSEGMGYQDGKPYVFKKTDKTENFYGLGEKADGLNKRGKFEALWHQDPFPYESRYLYQDVPFFIGLKDGKAYGTLFDNSYRSYYHLADERDDSYYFYADGGPLTYYVFEGPEIKNVLNRYTDLTGKMPLPPEWSLGFQQSSWSYFQKDAEEVAQAYRDKRIPADGIFFDIEWMNNYRAFEWGKNVPDPVGLNKKLDQLHFKLTNIFDPAIRTLPDYPVYQDGTKKDLWVKNADGSTYQGKLWPWDPSGPVNSVWPNFLSSNVRDWWSQQYKPIFDTGVDGIWNDVNEPVSFIAKDHWTFPLDAVYTDDKGSKHTHEEIHNLVPLLEEQGSFNAFKKLKPNVRPFILSRSGWAGIQRYAAIWTGDNHSKWAHLRMSIPMNANISLSGAPFVGNDIGGFTKDTPDGNDVTPELFARWVELGAFLPFARDHYNNSGQSPTDATNAHRQEPWQFGSQVEDISRNYIGLRYELMPYLQNAFRHAHETGEPIQQPLVYQFQRDPKTYNNEDEFMFGESLLVAPVIEEGATSRDVYLPSGTRWVDYWTGQEYDGGQSITKQADLGTLPMYVKADSIIPRRPVQQYAGEKPLTNLTLDTHLETEASYSYYQDDGESEDYTRGAFNLTDFDVEQAGNHIEFSQTPRVRRFNSEIQSYTLKLHDADAPARVQAAANKYEPVTGLDALDQQRSGYFYDTAAKVLYVKVPVNERSTVKIYNRGPGHT